MWKRNGRERGLLARRAQRDRDIPTTPGARLVTATEAPSPVERAEHRPDDGTGVVDLHEHKRVARVAVRTVMEAALAAVVRTARDVVPTI